MSGTDDLQRLWQNEDGNREDPRMWRELIQEKRTAWFELMGAEDQSWYLIAPCLALLTGWAAWKARYPWVHIGYGLMAATIALSAIATFIAGRKRSPDGDRNLREDLDSLIAAYDRRARYVRVGGWSVMLALSAGLVAIVMGIPGNAAKPMGWAIALILVAGGNAGQWLYCKQTVAKISRKREEATQLLQSLLAGPQSSR
jgi:hypothetical protein